jgi:hypothetical protein
MSGGRKIDDHSFWAGSKSKDSPFPMGVHHKEERSEEGDGEVRTYEDTTDKIKGQQAATKGKLKGHPLKAGYRN